MSRSSHWAIRLLTSELGAASQDTHTNLSAPSMHTYFALLKGLARSMISFITTPVKSAVDTPAGPHEKPFVLRTTFCSFLLFPAQTNVTGYVTFSYSDNSSFKVIFIGLATILYTSHQRSGHSNEVRFYLCGTYPSTENSQSGISSSLTTGTAP